jgi:hypothetical protein
MFYKLATLGHFKLPLLDKLGYVVALMLDIKRVFFFSEMDLFYLVSLVAYRLAELSAKLLSIGLY